MCLNMFYRSVIGSNLPNMFRRYMEAYNTCLNSRFTLAVPFARTNIFKNNFRIDATFVWNTLPSHLFEYDYYNKLKSETKQYLTSNPTY